METTYKVVDNPGQTSKRTGVFLKYKVIAAITVVVLVVLILVVVLAAFLGPGRNRSSSEACENINAKQISGDNKGKTCFKIVNIYQKENSKVSDTIQET